MSPPKSVPNSTSSLSVRPSRKLLQPFYTVAFVLALLVLYLNNNRDQADDRSLLWLLAVPAALFVWTMARDFTRRFSVLSIQGTKLRYESGLLSKATRTLDLGKVQDVTVEQSLAQRMVNIGTLRIETAGEQGGLTVANIDRPQAVADYILDSAGK